MCPPAHQNHTKTVGHSPASTTCCRGNPRPMSIDLPEYVDGLPNIAGHEKETRQGARSGGEEGGLPAGEPDRLRPHQARLRHRPAHAPAADPGRRQRPAHRRDHQQPQAHDGQPGHRRQPQRRRLPLVLQAHGRVHPAADRRGQAAARDAGVLRHAAARPAPDGPERRLRHSEAHHLRSPLPARRRVAGLPVGTRGGAVHAGAGFPPARHGLAASLRGDLRPGGAGAACAASRRRKWRCPTIRTSPTNSSRRCGTAATSGCWCRSTPSSAARTATARSTSTCRTAWSAATPPARRPRSSPSSRPRAATPSWSRRCSPTTRPRACRRWELAGKQVPPLVTQIADGENGGVMMNEFPGKYHGGHARGSGSETPAMNVTEYLEHLFAAGHQGEGPAGAPAASARSGSGTRSSRATAPSSWPRSIEELKKEDHRFHMEGGSWTNNISWVRGYDTLLGPMEQRQLAVLREGAQAGPGDRRSPLPQRAVPPAVLADQLLPLLGPGHLDRLRPGNLPPPPRRSSPRTTPSDQGYGGPGGVHAAGPAKPLGRPHEAFPRMSRNDFPLRPGTRFSNS